MTEITGASADGGVRAEVHPGGALAALSLDARALTLGPDRLAALVVSTVAAATAVANQRTKAALRTALSGLGEQELTLLGLHQERALTEQAEATTPRTWREAP